MLEFILVMKAIKGGPANRRLMDYALKKERERIKRAASVLLDKTPINIGKIRWRRWERTG